MLLKNQFKTERVAARPPSLFLFNVEWCARKDSNLRPTGS
jgi:hypothetical protein